MLIVILTGCELSRSEGENEDLAPVSELPPTLAPLGADSEELSGEATAIPTVINVQATATESPLGEGDAAVNPEEPVSPTTQAMRHRAATVPKLKLSQFLLKPLQRLL